MQNIDGMARDTTESTNRMNDVMNDSIKQIKVISQLLLFLVAHSRSPRTHIPPWVIAIGASVVTKDSLA